MKDGRAQMLGDFFHGLRVGSAGWANRSVWVSGCHCSHGSTGVAVRRPGQAGGWHHGLQEARRELMLELGN